MQSHVVRTSYITSVLYTSEYDSFRYSTGIGAGFHFRISSVTPVGSPAVPDDVIGYLSSVVVSHNENRMVRLRAAMVRSDYAFAIVHSPSGRNFYRRQSRAQRSKLAIVSFSLDVATFKKLLCLT